MKCRNRPDPRSKPAQLDQRAGGYVTLVSTHLSSLHSILSSARSPAPQKRGGGVGGCCCCALRRPRRSGDRRRRLRDSRGPSAAAVVPFGGGARRRPVAAVASSRATNRWRRRFWRQLSSGAEAAEGVEPEHWSSSTNDDAMAQQSGKLLICSMLCLFPE